MKAYSLRRRRRRSPGPRRPLAWVLIAVLSVIALGVLALAVQHNRGETAAGASDAAQYTAPPLATPDVVQNIGGGPRVTVVGDDLSTGPGGRANALWTTLVQRDLGASVTTLAATGSGYTASPQYGASRTFIDSAQQTVNGSVAVVFFGGANDAGAPTLTLIKAASEAFSDARGVAPKAKLIVVGPAWPTANPPRSVLAVRDALRTAAGLADATWVDPIQQRWLSRQSGLLSSDGVTLTEKGEQVVANRFRGLLASSIR